MLRQSQRLSGGGGQQLALPDHPTRRRSGGNLRVDIERARGISPSRAATNRPASPVPSGGASASLRRITSPALPGGASVLSISTSNVAMLKGPLNTKSLEVLLNDITNARSNGGVVNHPSQHFPNKVVIQLDMRRKAYTRQNPGNSLLTKPTLELTDAELAAVVQLLFDTKSNVDAQLETKIKELVGELPLTHTELDTVEEAAIQADVIMASALPVPTEAEQKPSNSNLSLIRPHQRVNLHHTYTPSSRSPALT